MYYTSCYKENSKTKNFFFCDRPNKTFSGEEKQRLLQEIHGNIATGHFGRNKTIRRLREQTLWESMKEMMDLLRTFMADNEIEWDQNLYLDCMAFNTAVHESTGLLPVEMTFGRKANLPSTLATTRSLTIKNS